MTENPSMDTPEADQTEPRVVADWTPRHAPGLTSVAGRTVVAERFDPHRHADALYQAIGRPEFHDLWEFIPMGPFDDLETFTAFFSGMNSSGTWQVYVFRRPDEDTLLGTASLMGIRPDAGVLEVGCVIYSPELKRSAEATELQYLLARHVFEDRGYRRYEWKCDARNTASRRAAERLEFGFEGVFRNHMVVRGLNRDTAWFSITDSEWPEIDAGFRAWLSEENFDATGTSRRSLASFRKSTAPC